MENYLRCIQEEMLIVYTPGMSQTRARHELGTSYGNISQDRVSMTQIEEQEFPYP